MGGRAEDVGRWEWGGLMGKECREQWSHVRKRCGDDPA